MTNKSFLRKAKYVADKYPEANEEHLLNMIAVLVNDRHGLQYTHLTHWTVGMLEDLQKKHALHELDEAVRYLLKHQKVKE